MANDLGTPLSGRKRRPKAGRGRGFPLARVLAVVIVLLAGGFVARLILVDDPDGGRPTQEAAITSTRNGNALANAVANGPVTITADPQQYPAGQVPSVPASAGGDRYAGLPDLSEETPDGTIPRIAANGQTPFQAYSTPLDAPLAADRPTIAIVVSGLGINEQGSLDAIDQLPAAVTLAFAPYGKSLQSTVSSARAAGHEVLLEIPLEPFDYPQNDPGPQTLLTGDAPRANLDKLFWLMARFGGYIGLINNMGARFTASGADFSPIMEELGMRGLGYVDDGSSNRSLAPQLAASNKVPFSRVDVVLDANPARAPILKALGSLEATAMQNGSAIGIISALPISVQSVAEWADELDGKGITLVPISTLMQ